jgi:hypothetical protein
MHSKALLGTKQKKKTGKLGKMKGDNMKLIPYGYHRLLLRKALKRYFKWKGLFYISNGLWLIGAILSLVWGKI